MREIIEHFCCRNDFMTYDRYDIWKTSVGFRSKRLYNRRPCLGIFPSAALAIADFFLNNRLRLFYQREEYPIVRAFSAMALLNLYRKTGDESHFNFAQKHVRWLVDHRVASRNGHGWGIPFDHTVSAMVTYPANMPLATITPYPLEAIIRYAQTTGDNQYDDVIRGIFDFFNKDIMVLEETDDYLLTSYGPLRDRKVVNAVSYNMYAHSLLLDYLPSEKQEEARGTIRKLYIYVKRRQNSDGSWLYSEEGRSFIDCFHSCIVLKNLIKTNRIVPLDDCETIVRAGYDYLKQNHIDERYGLYRRFSLKNRPMAVRFDLYDNAEMLNLVVLMKDEELIVNLSNRIKRHFHRGRDIYSHIDLFGVKRSKNHLRWAVMPYLYALSEALVENYLKS